MILSGILLTPTGVPYKNAPIWLTALGTSLNVLKHTPSQFKTDNDGAYSIDVPFGTYSVVVRLGSTTLKNVGVITIDADTTETNINELLLLNDTAISNPLVDEIRQAVQVTTEAAADVTEILQDMTDPNNTVVGFIRGQFGKSTSTVAGMLSAQTRNVWEDIDAITIDDRIDPNDPSTWYWDKAINAALQHGKKVLITEMLKVRRKISTKVSGAQLVGDGIDSAGLILDQIGTVGESFIGNCLLELGDSSVAAANTTHLGVSNLSINMGGRDIPAVVMLGARDGSYAKRLYIKNFTSTAFRTNMSGDGVGVAAGKMCEGVALDQIIAFPQNGITGDIFRLDGIFESTAKGCKAFGYTLAENNAVGFSVGKLSESRGVKLDACSTANMLRFGNPAAVNIGIVYGQWAKSCWDYNTTFENIEGGGVEFHGGTASGQLLPFDCRSVSPRPFFSSNLTVLNPLYKFRASNACHAMDVNHFSTVKANFQFTAENGFNNYATFDINAEPSAVEGTIVVFDAGCLTSNIVRGRASGVNLRKEMILTPDKQFYQILANGAYIQTDTFWTSHNAGTPNKIRMRDAALATLFEFDGTNGRCRSIKPFHPLGGQLITTQSVTGAGGAASYTPNMANAEFHDVTFSNATAFTVNAPSSLIMSARLMLKVTNGNGATNITPSFNAAYKGAPTALLNAGQAAYYEFVATSTGSLAYVNHVIGV